MRSRSLCWRASTARSPASITFFPPLLLVLAGWQMWNHELRWRDIAIFLIMYIPIGLGVTVGFHRPPDPPQLQDLAGAARRAGGAGHDGRRGAGDLVGGRPPTHDAYSDRFGDPHSPHVDHGGGWRGALRGLGHVPSGMPATAASWPAATKSAIRVCPPVVFRRTTVSAPVSLATVARWLPPVRRSSTSPVRTGSPRFALAPLPLRPLAGAGEQIARRHETGDAARDRHLGPLALIGGADHPVRGEAVEDLQHRRVGGRTLAQLEQLDGDMPHIALGRGMHGDAGRPPRCGRAAAAPPPPPRPPAPAPPAAGPARTGAVPLRPAIAQAPRRFADLGADRRDPGAIAVLSAKASACPRQRPGDIGLAQRQEGPGLVEDDAQILGPGRSPPRILAHSAAMLRTGPSSDHQPCSQVRVEAAITVRSAQSRQKIRGWCCAAPATGTILPGGRRYSGAGRSPCRSASIPAARVRRCRRR